MIDNNQEIEDKREFYRLIYLEEERPTMKIGPTAFQVMDISQGGLRFLNPDSVKLAEWVKVRLSLFCGDLLDLEGHIEWVQDDEFGLFLKDPLTSAILEKERLAVFH